MMFCSVLLGRSTANRCQFEKNIYKAIAPYFRGKSRGSKLKDIVLGTSMGKKKHIAYLCRCMECFQATFNILACIFTDGYMDEYATFIFCPEGTSKMKENAVSKISRAKAFIKYLTLGWPTTQYWTWEFLFNVGLLKS